MIIECGPFSSDIVTLKLWIIERAVKEVYLQTPNGTWREIPFTVVNPATAPTVKTPE